MTYIVYDLLECLSIELTDLNKEKINDTYLHRQPDSNIYDVVNNSEKRFRNKQRDIYLRIDFNINLNYNSYNQVNNFLDTIYSLGLFPLITKPIRITSHSATLIDIFTNIYEYVHMNGMIVCDISNHFPVFTCKKSLHILVNRYLEHHAIK